MDGGFFAFSHMNSTMGIFNFTKNILITLFYMNRSCHCIGCQVNIEIVTGSLIYPLLAFSLVSVVLFLFCFFYVFVLVVFSPTARSTVPTFSPLQALYTKMFSDKICSIFLTLTQQEITYGSPQGTRVPPVQEHLTRTKQ